MQVKFKKLHPDAKMPVKSHKDDAAFDLVATSKNPVMHHEMDGRIVTKTIVKYWEYGTSLAVHIPKNHVGLIFQRSSVSETSMILTNCVGVIDSGYLGELKFRFRDSKNGMRQYDVGERVGQITILPIPQIEFVEVDEFETTERDTKGWGSSGK